jgi:capsular exopolysaccharide synthesis family protein
MITSATPGEGKTTIASNLAISLAFSGAKTLVVDADLRRGRLHTLFDVPEDRQLGLSKVLQQEISWREAIVPTSTPNLSLLPRGRALAHPGEHFLSKVTDELLRDIYKDFEYIVFDSAPVMAADDALSLAPKIDGTIFVVRFAVSSVRSTRKSLELLAQRRVNLLGLVCNDVKLSESEYGYGYYYDYKHHDQRVEARA